MRNEKGSMSLILLLFIVIIFVGIFSINDYRAVIADDIKKGVLIQNSISNDYLKQGDMVLSEITDRYNEHKCIREGFWVEIFYAKVLFERARLEMEIEVGKE